MSTVFKIGLYRSARGHWLWFLALAVSLLAVTFAGNAQHLRSVPGRILVKPRPNLSQEEFSRRITAAGAFQHRAPSKTNVRLLSVPEERIEVLLNVFENDPDIEFAERDYVAQACMIDNDPLVISGAEWHLETIQALEAWDVTIGTSNTIIAVLDSGVNSASS